MSCADAELLTGGVERHRGSGFGGDNGHVCTVLYRLYGDNNMGAARAPYLIVNQAHSRISRSYSKVSSDDPALMVMMRNNISSARAITRL